MGRRRKGFRVLGPYERGDGRFSLVLKGPSVSGEEKPEWFYFDRRAEALKAQRELEAGLKTQLEATLAEAVDLYLDHLAAGKRQQSTRDEARARLNPLIRLAPLLVVDVDPIHIHQRLEQLRATSSKRGTLARMVAFFDFAVGSGLCRKNPCDGIKIDEIGKAGKPTLTPAEARVLADHLWADVQRNGADAEVAAAVLLVLYLGLRASELLRLQVRDIDLRAEPPKVSVERRAKTKTSFRDLEVPPEIESLLRARMEGRELADPVWPAPNSASGHRGRTWLLKGTRRLCRAAGVGIVCPQGLRATHGRLGREAGVSAGVIATQLGHHSTRVSIDHYISPEVERNQRARQSQRALRGRPAGPNT